MTFESWRISEYSTNVDYLLNHDGADAAGSSLLLTGLALAPTGDRSAVAVGLDGAEGATLALRWSTPGTRSSP